MSVSAKLYPGFFCCCRVSRRAAWGFHPSIPTYLHTSHTSHTSHTYIHTLHYITLHYIILRYSTVHYIALHYITLHYIALHYITYIQVRDGTYPASPSVQLYIAVPCRQPSATHCVPFHPLFASSGSQLCTSPQLVSCSGLFLPFLFPVRPRPPRTMPSRAPSTSISPSSSLCYRPCLRPPRRNPLDDTWLGTSWVVSTLEKHILWLLKWRVECIQQIMTTKVVITPEWCSYGWWAWIELVRQEKACSWQATWRQGYLAAVPAKRSGVRSSFGRALGAAGQ